ncbi:taste receptor type 2 member 40-like [Hyperolius riggenbachi]|uniref:taste receptor type 2 member 40-like n=1 Tax=Hyperolius riggenbachi TaxID=752182 RepID=UPI0035A2AB7C
MMSRFFIFTVCIDLIALLFSMPGNIFILLQTIVNANKSRKLQLSDHLIGIITLCDIFKQLLNISEDVLSLITMDGWSTHVATSVLLTLYLVLHSGSIWLSIGLCLHFCLKIVTIRQKKCLIFIQKMFTMALKKLLFSAIIQSLITTFFSILSMPTGSPENKTLTNTNQRAFAPMYRSHRQSAVFYYLVFLVSLFILSSSALLAVVSMLINMRRMKNNSEGSKTSSIETHLQATRTIISLLAISIVNFICGLHWYELNIEEMYRYISCLSSAIRFVLSPFIFIKVNNRLKKAFHCMLK